MNTKNNKQKNSTEAGQKEAVGLMGWLGVFAYKFSISSNTTFIEVIAKNFDEAKDKIEKELKVPKIFLGDLYLEKVTVVDISDYSQEVAK